MSKVMTNADIERLSAVDRLKLMEELWESLRRAPETVEVPDWHREELDRRCAAHERDPQGARSWEEVRRAILDELDE